MSVKQMSIYEYEDGNIMARDEDGKVHVLSTEIPVQVGDDVMAYVDCAWGCCYTAYRKVAEK